MSYVDGTAALRTNIAQDNAQRAQNARQFDSAMAMNMLQALMAQQRADADRGSEERRHSATLQTQRDLNAQTLAAQAAIANRQMDMQAKDAALKETLLTQVLAKDDFAIGDTPSPDIIANWDTINQIGAKQAETAGLRMAATAAVGMKGTVADAQAKMAQAADEFATQSQKYISMGYQVQEASAPISAAIASGQADVTTAPGLTQVYSQNGAIGKGPNSPGMVKAIDLAYRYADATSEQDKNKLQKDLQNTIYGQGGIGEDGAFVLMQTLNNNINDLRRRGQDTSKQVKASSAVGESGAFVENPSEQTVTSYDPRLESQVAKLQSVSLALRAVAPHAAYMPVIATAASRSANEILTNVDPQTGFNTDALRKLVFTVAAGGSPEEAASVAQAIAASSPQTGVDPDPKVHLRTILSLRKETNPELWSADQQGARQASANDFEANYMADLTKRYQDDLVRAQYHKAQESFTSFKSHISAFGQADPAKVEQSYQPFLERIQRLQKTAAERNINLDEEVMPVNMHKELMTLATERAKKVAEYDAQKRELATKQATDQMLRPVMPVQPVVAPGPQLQRQAAPGPVQPMTPEEFNRLPDAPVPPEPANILPQQGQKLTIPPPQYSTFGVGKM